MLVDNCYLLSYSVLMKILHSVLAEIPGAIGKLSKNVKNKRLKSILDSDLTKTGLDLAAGYVIDKLS